MSKIVSSCEPLVLPFSSSSLLTAFSASDKSFTSFGILLITLETVLMALTLSFSSRASKSMLFKACLSLSTVSLTSLRSSLDGVFTSFL